MKRAYNFSPGPAMLPQEVMEQAQAEFMNWQGSGMSAMEMSHRGPEFTKILDSTETDLRELLSIPDNYKVLFLQGGATLQFAAVPLNLLRGKKTADYVNTGHWSTLAIAEARRFCDVNVAASSEASGFTGIPPCSQWQCNAEAAYLHIALNETIHGVEFHDIPDSGDVPLVADASSTILSRPLDVSKFGLIYAGAQKNIGPAGLTVVIVREDLIGHAAAYTPGITDYQVQLKERSMYNTPPTFTWYMAGLVFKWLKAQGGLTVIAERNRRKSETLYNFLDESNYYQNTVEKEYRSWMNVPFTLADDSQNTTFLTEAKAAGLLSLVGHRIKGGMRASIYNAMPQEGVDALVDFMQDFMRRHG